MSRNFVLYGLLFALVGPGFALVGPKFLFFRIEKFDDDAAGIYVCSVQYDSLTVEGFVNAKIFVPDTTIKVTLNVSTTESLQVGDRAWLDCIVVGDAAARVEFHKEGSEELPANAQVREG